MSLNSLQFFEQLKERIKIGIEKKNFELQKLVKFIESQKRLELSEKLINVGYEFKFTDAVQKFNLYGNIFGIIKNYLRNYKKKNNLFVILITDEFIEQFFEEILRLLTLERFCSECNSLKIRSPYPISMEHLIFICDDCQKNVRVYYEAQHLPVFLMYIVEWIESMRKIPAEDFKASINPYREFINHLFINCFDHYAEKGDINALILFYEVLIKNKININVLSDKEYFKQILIENLKKSLVKHNLYDFIEGYNFYKLNSFGDIRIDIEGLLDLIFSMLLESLKAGKYITLKNSMDFFMEEKILNLEGFLLKRELKEQLENAYYKGLSKCLEIKEFGNFRELLEYSIKFDIFVDVKKIPDRFEHITNLLRECLQNIMGRLTSAMGDIIEIIRFFNGYNLLEKDFNEEELRFLSKLEIDDKSVSNLKDLFGKVSKSLIYFAFHDMPRNTYEFFLNEEFPYIDIDIDRARFDINQLINFILGYLNHYAVYGLSIQNLGKVKSFIRQFKTAYNAREEDLPFFEMNFRNRKHLISPDNLFKSLDKILDEHHYNFYSLSMVLLGGLGPQGHGFTYSTPRGEMVEVCSDQRESEAIIVKYKQFLKNQFLVRLEKEMENLSVEVEIVKKIINYLTDILSSRELINYYKKEPILKKLKSFFTEKQRNKEDFIIAYNILIDKISNAMDIILRPIDMIDQFKCRMDLVADEKINSEDIAKLTSLKDKSHYDVLRERFFFQHIIEAFGRIYDEERIKPKPKRYVS